MFFVISIVINIAMAIILVTYIKNVDHLSFCLKEAEKQRDISTLIWGKFSEYYFRSNHRRENLAMPPVEQGLLEDSDFANLICGFERFIKDHLHGKFPQASGEEVDQIIRDHVSKITRAKSHSKSLTGPELGRGETEFFLFEFRDEKTARLLS